MTPSTALARLRLATRLCKLGARLILVAGLVVDIYLGLFVIYDPGSQQPIDLRQVLTTLALMVLIALPVFFFFIFLSAFGAFLDYTSAVEKTEEPIEEPIEITSL